MTDSNKNGSGSRHSTHSHRHHSSSKNSRHSKHSKSNDSFPFIESIDTSDDPMRLGKDGSIAENARPKPGINNITGEPINPDNASSGNAASGSRKKNNTYTKQQDSFQEAAYSFGTETSSYLNLSSLESSDFNIFSSNGTSADPVSSEMSDIAGQNVSDPARATYAVPDTKPSSSTESGKQSSTEYHDHDGLAKETSAEDDAPYDIVGMDAVSGISPYAEEIANSEGTSVIHAKGARSHGYTNKGTASQDSYIDLHGNGDQNSSHQHHSSDGHSSGSRHHKKHSSDMQAPVKVGFFGMRFNNRMNANGYTKRAYEKRYGKKKNKMSIKKKILLGILFVILFFIVAVAATFLVLRYRGEQNLISSDVNIDVPEWISSSNSGNDIYYDGKHYTYNDNIATILFMGIDNEELEDDVVIGTAGRADALYLYTYDTSTGSSKILTINRDTMTDINRYTDSGTFYDTATAQICLAFAYGDGGTFSAENTVTAVERLIYNIPINAYYAIDLTAIAVLNDSVGGVTLTSNYTFYEFEEGQSYTLMGEQATMFVRYRDITLLDDNLRRIECQKQYLNAFASKTVQTIKENYLTPWNMYKASEDYTITNIDTSDLVYLASEIAFNYSGLDFVSIDGKYKDVEDDPFAQFKVNKTSLLEAVLDIFYNEVQ